MLSKEVKMAKTTLVLDEGLLARAAECAGTKTKKATVETGLRELIKRHCRDNLREMLGKEVVDLTDDELELMRADD